MKPDADRGSLLGALFQRREPHGGLHGSFGIRANDPSGQTAQAGMSRAPPSVYRHRREGLPLGTSSRGCFGSPWESPRKPRRKSGHEEDTSPWKERADPGARKGAGRNGPVRRETPRSRGSRLIRRHFCRPAMESRGRTSRERPNGKGAAWPR